MENIQKLLCEMQYKGKLAKRPHHWKPFNFSKNTRNHLGVHLVAKTLLA